MRACVVDGARLAFTVEGPTDAPVLVLSNSLGTDLHMWEPQREALSNHVRLVRYDSRGHGRSDAPAGDYTPELWQTRIEAVPGWRHASQPGRCRAQAICPTSNSQRRSPRVFWIS